MSLIHRQPLNYLLRTIMRPFRKIMPKKFHFAIDGEISVPLKRGRSMKMTGNPTSNMTRFLFWRGSEEFEPEVYDIFTSLSESAACFIDIGANLGYYSILARIFNPNIEVHAFEPVPGIRKYLQMNTALNHFTDIRVNEIAMSDKRGEATFYSHRNPRFEDIEDHLFGDSRLIDLDPSAYNKTSFKVVTDTLDNYAETHVKGKRIDLIKMDTEGTEIMVLRGAHLVLSVHKPIIMCEVLRNGIETEMESLLSKYGYSFFKVDNGRLTATDNLRTGKQKEDYFFVEAGRLKSVSKFIS
jgi:FkbM family methyltransferase